MNRYVSIYLDLVRFLAAVVVFFVHANYDRFTTEIPLFWVLRDSGNDAVMAFFVLSGFVIAYVVDKKEKTPKEYFISRFARLYSVVIPALLITYVLDHLGSRIAFSVYDGWWYANDNPIWRVFANMTFVNELWFTSTRPFTNGPFWSLGYEFWYYTIFAAAWFLRGWVKIVVVGLLCLLVGPKILLLLPVWLLGVQAYHIVKKRMVSEKLGWVLFIVSSALYAFYRFKCYPDTIYDYMLESFGTAFVQDKLLWSQEFISSYIIGTLVATHFIGMAAIAPRFANVLRAAEKPIRYLAGYTFALYLLHYPLLQFFAAVATKVGIPFLHNLIVIFGSLAAVWALGAITEKRKADWRRLMQYIFDGFTTQQPRKSSAG
jgi:peptidoglycan/LPS O-acetylase OafA/YrhL